MSDFTRYEVKKNDKLGRYLVAARDLKGSDKVLSDAAFVLGPHGDSALVCFRCHLPLLSKFVCCKMCAVAPVCPGEGCPDHLPKFHNKDECDLFAKLKLSISLSPFAMVQNVGALIVLRALLKRSSDAPAWAEFLQLETHLEQRRNTEIWEYYDKTAKFIESLGLLEGEEDKDLIQKICAAIDVNSFEVRGPAIPAIGCAEILRGIYLKAALLAHDCIGNTQMSINDNNLLVCHATTDIKKGEAITYNYTDSLKGTGLRQQHLMISKYFKCACARCADPTEMGTYMSSAKCPHCKTGFLARGESDAWNCLSCQKEFENSNIGHKVQCCTDKLGVINKKDEKELEEYIRNVSIILAPNHYLLVDAKQRLAGVLRDTINREPHPTKRILKRKIEICEELLPVLEKLNPGISRTTAITLYELHAAMVQLSKKLFDAREITGSDYMDELLSAEKLLKRSLEMLFIEPGNSPEGELCAKALEEYRALKATIGTVLDGIHAEGRTYVSVADKEQTVAQQPTL
ncbi:hypothetical protein JYU34_001551 [Plutella xylostella]|uniref:SET domain-containing protein n=1 Tax=Plutella xylostella TaxID=51655 RepID=A0ABQ7R472_PLUXY|nr:hypothetical protein JYU34_001551 [Plutella xylostella]